MKNQEGIATPVLDRTDTYPGQSTREPAVEPGAAAARSNGGFKETLGDIGAKLGNGRDTFIAKTKKNWQATDAYVGKNPWWAVGVSAGVAFLAGMLISRKRR